MMVRREDLIVTNEALILFQYVELLEIQIRSLVVPIKRAKKGGGFYHWTSIMGHLGC